MHRQQFRRITRIDSNKILNGQRIVMYVILYVNLNMTVTNFYCLRARSSQSK